MVYFLSHLKNLLVKVWDILEFLNFILQSHAFLKLHLNYAKFREVSRIVCTMLLISCPSACDDATRSLSPCEFPILRLFPFFLHCSRHHFFSRYSSRFASLFMSFFPLFSSQFQGDQWQWTSRCHDFFFVWKLFMPLSRTLTIAFFHYILHRSGLSFLSSIPSNSMRSEYY